MIPTTLKNATVIGVFGLAMTPVAMADFTSIDTLGGINAAYLDLDVADFMGGHQSDNSAVLGGGIGDFPLFITNQIQTGFGVSGSGSASISVSLDSPTSVSTTGAFNGVANTFGVQGAAQGGAGGGVFFRFTLDTAAQIQMDWLLSDFVNNNNDDLGGLTLYETNLNGSVLFDVNQDGNGLDMMGSDIFALDAGQYLLFASSEVRVNANEFDGEVLGSAGFDVSFTIIPSPATLSLVLPSLLIGSRRRRY